MDPREATFITTAVGPAIVDAFEAVGGSIVSGIQQDISTPYPPASTPGTPPHKRTGNLIAQTNHEVITTIGSGRITLTVFNSAAYAAYLRDGTSRMGARDFFRESSLDNLTPRVVDAVVDEITERFGT
jgi:hypothetical protein